MSEEKLIVEVGSFAVNCTILVFGRKAFVVDPGAEAERIAAELDRRSLEPVAILLTHAHFDHIGAVGELRRRYPAVKVAVGAEDAKIVSHPFNQYPPDYPPTTIGETVDPAETVKPFGGEVISTPGHTPGGVAYYFPAERLLFSGDTLFRRSFGRTDFPGGDMSALIDSLRKLAKLPPETEVVPGHGPLTTIAAELRDGALHVCEDK